MFGASRVPIDFLWASLRGITRKPVDGAAGPLLSPPVTSKLFPADFLRVKALRPNGGIEIMILQRLVRLVKVFPSGPWTGFEEC